MRGNAQLLHSLIPLLVWFARRAHVYGATNDSCDACVGPTSTQQWEAMRLTSDYDAATRPGRSGVCGLAAAPDVVEVQLRVVDFKHVDAVRGELEVMVYFRTWWRDPRLAYGDASSNSTECMPSMNILSFLSKIWVPDVSVENMSDDDFWVTSTPEMLVLLPDGSIFHSKKVRLKISCEMLFARMPFDGHACALDIVSYAYSSTDMRVVAKGGTLGVKASGISISGGKGITHPLWRVERGAAFAFLGQNDVVIANDQLSLDPRSMDADAHFTQEWDYVRAVIHYTRDPWYFLKSVLIPDTMILMFVYTGFFIQRSVVPGRVALVAFGLLIERNMINGVYLNLPQIAYSVWLLDYLLCSLALMFVAALEYGMVSYFLSQEKHGAELMARLKLHAPAIRAMLDAGHDVLHVQADEDHTTVVLSFSDRDDVDDSLSDRDDDDDDDDCDRSETRHTQPEAPARRARSVPVIASELRAPKGPPVPKAAVDLLELIKAHFLQVADPEISVGENETRALLVEFNVLVSGGVMHLLWTTYINEIDPSQSDRRLTFKEFVELALGVNARVDRAEHQSKTKHGGFRVLPRSLQLDVFFRWVFPFIITSKILIFGLLVKTYPTS